MFNVCYMCAMCNVVLCCICIAHTLCILCAVYCFHCVFPLCYTLYKDTPVDVYQGHHTLYNLGARRQVGFSLGSSEAPLFGD